MKNRLYILLIINAIIISCMSPLKSNGDKTFYAIQYGQGNDNGSMIRFSASLVKTTDLIEVYVRDGYSVDSSKINTIINEFEKEYSTITNTYGTYTDVDKNGKILFVFFNINKVEVTSGGYVGGYFYSGDLIEGYGNNAEILYIDCLNGLDKAITTVIHEFQHLINYNMTVLEYIPQTDTWLNEALSESTEVVYKKGKPPLERISYFNADYNRYSGNYFYTWTSDVINYASACTFMYWLYLQSGNNYNIYKDIAQAPRNIRGNYNALVKSVNKHISGLQTSDWKKILLTWFLANYKNDSSGLYGYKNTISYKYESETIKGIQTFTPQKSSSDVNILLYPGAAIYYNGSPVVKDDGKVQYTNLTSSVMLVFNYDTSLNNPLPVSVTIPAGKTQVSRSIKNNIPYIDNKSKVDTKPMPIDKHPPLIYVGENK